MNDEIEYLRKVYQSEDTSTWVNKLQMKSIVDYADKLQSNWNSLRELIDYQLKHNVGSSIDNSIRNHVYQEIKNEMNKLEGRDYNE